MRLQRTRRAALAATALLALTALLAAAPAQAARGGLSITPGIFEHAARPGGLGAVEVSNTTAKPMRVRVIARPWIQSRSGSVTPNRRRTLGAVRPSRSSFRLAPGASRSVGLSLASRPARGSIYGAIEVTGAPIRPGGRGIRVAYRLISSLRLFPPAGSRVFRPRAVRLFQFGSSRRGALFLSVKNAGNTIDPIGASVRITGHGRVLRNEAAPKAILPGSTVNLRLTRLHGTLSPGRYRVTVRLTQAGRVVGTVRSGVRLR